MDVRCPQCQTLYELDDGQVRRKAVTLKCSQCQHVFRLESASSVVQENQRRWMVRRKKEGDILYLNTFDVLHEWIMKQEVREEDEISRTGDTWATLGEIGEFLPMFQVVASISALESDESDRPDVSSIATRVPERTESPTPAERTQTPNRARVRTAVQFGGESSGPRPEPMRAEEITKRARPTEVTPHDLPPSPTPAPREAASTRDADASTSGARAAADAEGFGVDLSREVDVPVTSSAGSGAGVWVLLGVLLVAGITGYIWFSERDLLSVEDGDPNVVAIGTATQTNGTEEMGPTAVLQSARDDALEAVQQENDAIWTMWHEEASRPFYIALDTAYAAADEASVDVELDEILKDARRALENGQLVEANRAFRTVLAKDPSSAAAVTGLGWTLLGQGHADQAVQQFRTAMRMDENYGDAYIGLGSAYRNTGEYQKAYDVYDLYLGRFPRGEKASIASYQMSQLKKQLGL